MRTYNLQYGFAPGNNTKPSTSDACGLKGSAGSEIRITFL